MHALIPACCNSFLQPSASAHLRGQVKNGPGDACTYTGVLRFVLAAFCKCATTVKLQPFCKGTRILGVYPACTQNAACPAHGGLRSLINGQNTHD